MIRKVHGSALVEFDRLTPMLLTAFVAQALSQAAAYLLLVPASEALFDDNLSGAWMWALWMVAAVSAVIVFAFLQVVIGLRLGVGPQRGSQARYPLTKVTTSVLVPSGIAVGMLFIDWRVSVAMLFAAPVLYAINSLADGTYTRSD